jgi:DNA-binding NarL/FixJ family response regulator
VQFLLSLPGRSEASKEKEKRKDNTYEPAREGQVLQLLFRHLTNKEIAVQLNIRERTAKFHVSNLLRKLALENRRNLLVSPLVE